LKSNYTTKRKNYTTGRMKMGSTKKKLLVMTSTFPRWKDDSIPPFVYDLSKRLVNDFDVYILAPHYPKAKRFEIMEGMTVYRFRYFFEKLEKLAGNGGMLPTVKKNKLYWLLVPFFLMGEYFALGKLVKKIKPDIIHAHWIIPQGIIANLINKKTKIPYIITSHGSDILGIRGCKNIKRRILRDAKAITVVSNTIKKEIIEQIDHQLRIEVIPMGLDTKLFNPSRYDEEIKKKYGIKGPLLLFVGRLAPEKGIIYLVDAMQQVIKKYPNAKLMIIGDGTLTKKLYEKVNNLKLRSNVIFRGWVNHKELPKYYTTSDLFISPSTREGSPVSWIESLACGTPILVREKVVPLELSNQISKGIYCFKKNEQIGEEICNILSIKYFKNLEGFKIISKNYNWEQISRKFYDLIQ
jgi:glycosyltransferase involved in cell wall biosynthesis